MGTYTHSHGVTAFTRVTLVPPTLPLSPSLVPTGEHGKPSSATHAKASTAAATHSLCPPMLPFLGTLAVVADDGGLVRVVCRALVCRTALKGAKTAVPSPPPSSSPGLVLFPRGGFQGEKWGGKRAGGGGAIHLCGSHDVGPGGRASWRGSRDCGWLCGRASLYANHVFLTCLERRERQACGGGGRSQARRERREGNRGASSCRLPRCYCEHRCELLPPPRPSRCAQHRALRR